MPMYTRPTCHPGPAKYTAAQCSALALSPLTRGRCDADHLLLRAPQLHNGLHRRRLAAAGAAGEHHEGGIRGHLDGTLLPIVQLHL